MRKFKLDVINNTSNILLANRLVYCTGYNSALNLFEVDYSSCDNPSTVPAIGVLVEDMAVGQVGNVKIAGTQGLFDTDGYSVNTPIYLGLNGNILAINPKILNSQYAVQQVGIVLNTDTTDGIILFQTTFDAFGTLPEVTGVYGAGLPGQVTFWTGDAYISGTNNFFYNYATNSLGIGTNAPTEALEVDGYIVPHMDAYYGLGKPSLRWGEVYVGPDSLHISSNASETGDAYDWKIGIDRVNVGNFNVGLNGNTYLSIDSYGNVNLGTASLPNTPLTSSGPIAIEDIANDPASVGGYGKLYVKNNQLYFITPQGIAQLTSNGGGLVTGGGQGNQIAVWATHSSLDGYDNFQFNGITNQLILEGSMAINTSESPNSLDVSGSVAIGSYAGLDSAPQNSLIVSGNIGVGTTNPQATLSVSGFLSLYDQLTIPGSLSGQGILYTNNADHNLYFTSSAGVTSQLTPLLTQVSQSAHFALAAPNGAAGNPVFRQLDATDFTGFAPSATIDATNANNITSGDLSPTVGGTGQTTYTLGDTLYSSATNTLSKLSGNTSTIKKYLNQTGTGSLSSAPLWSQILVGDLAQSGATLNQVIQWNGSTWAPATSAGSVTGTGTANQVSYWSGTTSLTSSANLTFDGSNLTLATGGIFKALTGVYTNSLNLTNGGSNALTIQMPGSTTAYTVFMPGFQGAANTYLMNDGAGNLSWSAVTGGGSITGSGVSGYLTYWNGTNSVTNDSGLSTDGAGNLSSTAAIHASTLSANTLLLNSVVSINAPGVSSYNINLPTIQGAANTTLQNDGSGNLSWVAVSGGISGSGASGQISYFNGGSSITSSANLTFTGSNLSSPVLTATAQLKAPLIQLLTGSNGIQILPNPSAATLYTIAFPAAQGSSNTTLINDGSGNLSWTSAVTSVSATVPSFLSVSGTPITSSGTLAISVASQPNSYALMGPFNGSSNAQPTFRQPLQSDIGYDYTTTIVEDDFLNLDQTYGSISASGYLYPPWNLITLGSGSVIGDQTTFLTNGVNHPGVLQFSSGSTAVSTVTISMASQSVFIDTTCTLEIECIVQLNSLSTSSQRYAFYCGAYRAISFPTGATTNNRGVWFSYTDNVSSGQWVANTQGQSTPVSQATGISAVAGTWYRLGIILNATNARYYINGTLAATISTSAADLPLFGGGSTNPTFAPAATLYNTIGTIGSVVYLDKYYMKISGLKRT